MIPSTREEALAALEDFVPRMPAYAAGRNYVGRPAVSLLSAAIRHRLILEEEVVERSLAAHPFSRIEKWLQEMVWRTYWKGWLEARPGVWDSFVQRVDDLRTHQPTDVLKRADDVAAGRSGVAAMDRFARELLETGYVHNHARMWWASFWIHVERLPWELGAAHYLEHLNDADPASNTLSWRWVAGLQTKGKTYLVRRSNLEKYCDSLESDGLERLEDGRVSAVEVHEYADLNVRPLVPVESGGPDAPCVLWLHEDDLLPEVGPLASARPTFVVAIGPTADRVSRFRRTAMDDGLRRASAHFGCPAHVVSSVDEFVGLSGGRPVVAFAPFVGPAQALAAELQSRVSCTFVRRAWDERHFRRATRGFFPFWAAVSKELK
ncbi:MAG: FAD-binding domain-containing protein [Terrimicrobiaceae bacterium]|nr:FAD-binding domain-containing protein [Terrimicrobiaceae bacterium]